MDTTELTHLLNSIEGISTSSVPNTWAVRHGSALQSALHALKKRKFQIQVWETDPESVNSFIPFRRDGVEITLKCTFELGDSERYTLKNFW